MDQVVDHHCQEYPSSKDTVVVDSTKQDNAVGYSSSYKGEWDRLFMDEGFLKPLKTYAIQGNLRSSRFRSVCWKVFLDVLPHNVKDWITKSRAWRDRYDHLKQSLIVNPRREEEIDPTVHNPLSQESDSPWNRFFQDNELRLTIKQDVIRTYPDIEFFKASGLRETMTQVLFCYAKLNSRLGYRQGMHELLAPLIFVLHCDHQAFLHACELEPLSDVLKEVMDPAYVEHDAFALFCQIMETAEHWYVSKEVSPTVKPKGVSTKPFARAQDVNPSNVIVNKLTRIQDYLLKQIDVELYLHLQQMEIPPQIYGIRWLRLLFGREFPMQDLLVVWDSIYADSVGFELVDYIFVAMLLYLREALLTSDYPTCLHFLMKYPPVGDINYFIQKAFYLREPSQNNCPPAYTYQKPASLMNSSYGDMFQGTNGLPTTFIANTKVANSARNTGGNKMSVKASAMVTSGFASLTRRLSANNVQSKSRRTNTLPRNLTKAHSEPHTCASESSSPVTDTGPPLFHPSSHRTSAGSLSHLEDIPGTDKQGSQPERWGGTQSGPQSLANSVHLDEATPAEFILNDRTRAGSVPQNTAVRSRTHISHTAKNSDLEQRVSFLLGRVTDMESMCYRCADKMDVHIDKLQGDMMKGPVSCEDELLLALAGLKQVRDVLKGVLKPASIFDTAEMKIRDDHYLHEESPARIQMQPRRTGPDSPDSTGTDTTSVGSGAASTKYRSGGGADRVIRTPSLESPTDNRKKRTVHRKHWDESPVTPSAILKHDLLGKAEVELANFHRLDTPVNQTDQSPGPDESQVADNTNRNQTLNKPVKSGAFWK